MAKDAAIQQRLDQLPVKPELLNKWLIIKKGEIQARSAALKAVKKMDDGLAGYQAALKDTQDLAIHYLYAKAKLWKMIKARPKQVRSSQGGTSKPLPAGIDKTQSHQSHVLYDNQKVIAKIGAKAVEDGTIPLESHVYKAINVHVGRNAGEHEWYTPQEYIDAARKVMGTIDVDPATTADANKQIKAKKYYTVNDSGLTKKWKGNVWMNPPYAQPHITDFCNTFAQKFRANEITAGCILINNTTETTFGQELLELASVVCFIAGRVKFLDIDGKPGAPLQGQMLIYCGSNGRIFKKVFSEFGICLVAK